jgi:hypothetical protein
MLIFTGIDPARTPQRRQGRHPRPSQGERITGQGAEAYEHCMFLKPPVGGIGNIPPIPL